MTAQDRGWGRGYPVNRVRDMVSVNAGGVQVSVHKDIAELVRWLLEETTRRGYRLRRGECWGYANRTVRGSSAPSNHSWGLAVDINAPSNPMADHLVTDMPVWMPALWKAWGFDWGGDYRGRKDAMHFEFTGTPQDAKARLAKLKLVEDAAHLQTTVVPPMEVTPMFNPPVEIAGKVVAVLKAPGGGVWMLTEPGAVYAWECKDHDAPNRHPEYWQPGQRAARLEALGDGYRVVDSQGHFYEYP